MTTQIYICLFLNMSCICARPGLGMTGRSSNLPLCPDSPFFLGTDPVEDHAIKDVTLYIYNITIHLNYPEIRILC